MRVGRGAGHYETQVPRLCATAENVFDSGIVSFRGIRDCVYNLDYILCCSIQGTIR